MKVLRALVVEDEGLARRRIEKMIIKHEQLELIPASAKNGPEALRKIKESDPDLIFMDIELKDYNAFDILDQLGPKNHKIIFVTAFNTYASKAFEVDAVDYLLKPYTEERFRKSVERVISRGDEYNFDTLKNFLKQKPVVIPSSKVVIPEGNTRHYMDGDHIEYIYGQGYYANFVMHNQKKLVRISLKALETLLPIDFCRINKSTIINKIHIKELIRNKNSLKIIMEDHNEFYVTDNYREQSEKFLK